LRETTRAKSASEDWKGDGDTTHIILVEASCRQIYPAAPSQRYDRFRNARVCRLSTLSRGSAIAAALPLPLLYAAGQFLGFCAWLISGKYRRLAERNVAIALGDQSSPVELRRLVRRHFQRLGANLLCSAKLTQMPPEQILRRVKVENIEAMDREFRAGVSCGARVESSRTWELFAQLMPKFVGYVRNASVYQKLAIVSLTSTCAGRAAKLAWNYSTAKPEFQPVIDLLRSGGGVGVLSDQHAGDHGLWTPFSEDWRRLRLCLVCLRSGPERRSSPLEFTRPVQHAGAWCSPSASTSPALPLQTLRRE